MRQHRGFPWIPRMRLPLPAASTAWHQLIISMPEGIINCSSVFLNDYISDQEVPVREETVLRKSLWDRTQECTFRRKGQKTTWWPSTSRISEGKIRNKKKGAGCLSRIKTRNYLLFSDTHSVELHLVRFLISTLKSKKEKMRNAETAKDVPLNLREGKSKRLESWLREKRKRKEGRRRKKIRSERRRKWRSSDQRLIVALLIAHQVRVSPESRGKRRMIVSRPISSMNACCFLLVTVRRYFWLLVGEYVYADQEGMKFLANIRMKKKQNEEKTAPSSQATTPNKEKWGHLVQEEIHVRNVSGLHALSSKQSSSKWWKKCQPSMSTEDLLYARKWTESLPSVLRSKKKTRFNPRQNPEENQRRERRRSMFLLSPANHPALPRAWAHSSVWSSWASESEEYLKSQCSIHITKFDLTQHNRNVHSLLEVEFHNSLTCQYIYKTSRNFSFSIHLITSFPLKFSFFIDFHPLSSIEFRSHFLFFLLTALALF